MNISREQSVPDSAKVAIDLSAYETTARRLAAAATDLNRESDALRAAVVRLDGRLANMNLGLNVWVQIPETNPPVGLGYTKIGNNWALAASMHVQPNAPPAMKPLADCERALLVLAIGALPSLLEALAQECERMVGLAKRARPVPGLLDLER